MQSAQELREQAVRFARIAASLGAEDAAVLVQLARESLSRADDIDGGVRANGHDVEALIEIALSGNKPARSAGP